MHNNSLSLSAEFTKHVEFTLSSEDEKTFGELTFHPKKLPLLDFEYHDFEESKSFETIECASTTDNGHYSLVNCKLAQSRIHPRYVLKGKTKSTRFDGFQVVFSDITNWFIRNRLPDIDKKEIRKSIPQDTFKTIINTDDGDRIRISNKYDYYSHFGEENEIVVEEYVTLQVESLDRKLALDEIERKSFELRNLFSLILGWPIDIRYVWVYQRKERGLLPLYFTYFPSDRPSFEYSYECLIQPHVLSKKGQWRTMFRNFHCEEVNKRFKQVWSRLVGLYVFKGLWEYEFLGYVSVLDAFSNRFVKGKTKKLKEQKFSLLMNDLIKTANGWKENLEETDFDVIDNLAESIKDNIKNTNLPSFKKKFNVVLNSLPPKLQEILGFSEEEFEVLKKLRNQIAHGSPPKLKKEHDITFEYKIRDKLLILLSFFIYSDLGFRPREFMKCISRSHHKWIRNADINELALREISGSAKIVRLGKADFDTVPN